MHMTRTSTQTGGDHGDAARAQGPAPALVRFFRADDPFGATHQFNLVGQQRWTIGRLDAQQPPPSGGDQIWSVDDAEMSGRHATVATHDAGFSIADARSKNGTFLNGERITSPTAIADRDILQMGASFFMFVQDARAPGDVRHAPATSNSSPLWYQIEEVAPFAASELSLHLVGETGTGKDIVAREVHELSGRRGAFIALNCAAIPEHLFESELFGYRRGAFSGAMLDKPGHVVAADGGTLFLDEIGELSLPLQAKLLRVLESKEVLPLGATVPTQVSFRLLSATLCDLEDMAATGRFRRDLLARLGRPFRVGPLRDHKEYLGPLIQRLLLAAVPPGRLPRIRFQTHAAQAIVRHSWPLNVRELKHCIDGAITASRARGAKNGTCVVELGDLPRSLTAEAASGAREHLVPRTAVDPKHPASDEQVIAALQSVSGNRAAAAAQLGVSERTVFRRVGRLRKRGVGV
jgi:transcriptional regulator with PAS, ATPase and Fis domain